MKKLFKVMPQLVMIFLVVTTSGCNNISESYCRARMKKRTCHNTNLANGVDSREAIIIAQRTLLNSKYNNDYYVSKPILGNDEKYNLWGVSFKSKKSGYDKCGYSVMINKTSGKIDDGCFSGL